VNTEPTRAGKQRCGWPVHSSLEPNLSFSSRTWAKMPNGKTGALPRPLLGRFGLGCHRSGKTGPAYGGPAAAGDRRRIRHLAILLRRLRDLAEHRAARQPVPTPATCGAAWDAGSPGAGTAPNLGAMRLPVPKTIFTAHAVASPRIYQTTGKNIGHSGQKAPAVRYIVRQELP
jgi:hypothetical protein